MAISRLQASLASATNEVTVAAANINFEFTLVKYEAPKEYQPLGQILSAKRKKDAEYGSSHVTARRLGALFEGVCPNTPNLVRTYGERVSEISKSAIDKDHNEYSQSIFSAYAGIDATSIWAAATSSKAALHVHLLACMLARFWEPPEAVSIWVELVKKRREDIATKLEDGDSLPFAMATAAAQGEIARAQLAEWDASARAWIRTADEIKSRQQTQLQLVLKNIDAPVTQLTNVYSGVLDVWTSALKVMENLLSEMPQAVRDGATLLGLASWHIYPDLVIFGSRNVEICMNDMAVPRGGVLSLGLSSPQENYTRGIYWSLSLAHLRYYGPSVRARRRLSEDPKRILFPRFQLATLGVILGYWHVPLEETTESIRLLLAITETLQQSPRWAVQDRWIDMISQPALEYLSEHGEEDSELISRSDHPFFGLRNLTTLLECLKGPEERLAFLRHMVSKSQNLHEENTIVYNTLPDATVTVSVLNQVLVERHWASAVLTLLPVNVVPPFRNITLSLVAYFEGFIDTDPDNLKDAFALCSGDSIYLVCDPFEAPRDIELKRILGNIGKPGVVFLVSPQAPIVRDPELGRWSANYSQFDGTAMDSFSTTSLHLSFTDYHVPIFENDSRGDQDFQASILEAVVSVRDSGNWIADVGILRAFKEGYISRPRRQRPCSHPDNSAPEQPIIAVECWDDILDNPDGVFVVKAHGNWIARLAITAVLAEHSRTKKDLKITVVPNSVCWKCLAKKYTRRAFVY
ncbi:hypothetical protein FQN52_004104 [Onygenales sp. PD_12]|nr:hypothetical protein FQN52_004104 [Onygenales sp. PD_12]